MKLVKPYFVYNKNRITKGKWDLFNSKKIVIRGMATKLTAAYDDIGYALGVSTYTITKFKYHPNYLLALLNSKLLDFYYKSIFKSKHLAGGFIAYNVGQLSQLPIKTIEDEEDNLIELVEEIKNAKKKNDDKNFEKLYNKINQIVYKIYGITPKEQKIMEESLK
jgi:hypothetical protein